MNKPVNKRYKTVVISIDNETGEEEEVLNDEYNGIVILGDKDESISEAIMNLNIVKIAAMISSSKNMKMAAKLSNAMMSMHDDIMSGFEDQLSEMLEGGLQ